MTTGVTVKSGNDNCNDDFYCKKRPIPGKMSSKLTLFGKMSMKKKFGKMSSKFIFPSFSPGKNELKNIFFRKQKEQTVTQKNV
jgi:hypothetical protein